MKKIYFTIFILLFLFLLISCKSQVNKENNNNQNTWIKNEENVSDCSETETWTQCKIDSETSSIKNNLDTNIENMKNTYQTELPQNWDLVAIMKTTNWTIKIRLFEKDVPTVVDNFIWLASDGYYNWIIFHRVINNFMIQWWDPTWTGMWWESIYWEKFDDEFSDKLSNIRWAIAMANAWPDTNGSQFFINQKDNTNLDFNKEPLTSKHAVFWQVYEWMENVDKIAKTKTWENDKPEKDVKIISIDIKQMENWKLVDYKVDKNKYIENYNKLQEEKKEANKNREVKSWDKIKVDYTLELEDWTVFDTSIWKTPFEFTVWVWQVIPWFDNWVIWMKIWDKKTLYIEPKNWYWEYDENNKQVLKLSDLGSFIDAWIKIEKWSTLPTMYWNFKIIDVSWEDVTIDTNSELAWKNLIFDIELLDFVD